MVALGVAVVSTGSSGGEEPGGAVALRARRVVRVVAMTGPCFPETAAATSFCLLPVFFPMVPNRRTRSQQFGDGKFFALYDHTKSAYGLSRPYQM